MKRARPHPLEQIFENRIAIIDGAMGTTIRTYGMKEADSRNGDPAGLIANNRLRNVRQ